jgi:hypothetical protein
MQTRKAKLEQLLAWTLLYTTPGLDTALHHKVNDMTDAPSAKRRTKAAAAAAHARLHRICLTSAEVTHKAVAPCCHATVRQE